MLTIKGPSLNCLIMLVLFIIHPCVFADNEPEAQSPWLLTPLLSVDPKLSSSLGVIGGYIYQFDEDSPSSMFGVSANYSDTKSWTAAAFAKTYFDQDKQRITAAMARGEIRNDYDDYLGTGLEVKTKDQLEFFIFRYSHQIWSDWYLGLQVLNSHYQILGLEQLWVNANNLVTEPPGFDNESIFGFDSLGVGLLLEFDSRNDQRAASAGNYFLVHNIAYRESFGGDEDFDTLDMRFTHYFAHGNGHVLAMNISGRWTDDAPPSGYSSVFTKGYTRGQYLAPYLSSIELDERLQFSQHWGMTVYAAVACLYGELELRNNDNENLNCTDSDNIYPSAALGLSYALKPEENIFLRAEAAAGKGDNRGVYLSFGHPF
jgi:hypothetical protein